MSGKKITLQQVKLYMSNRQQGRFRRVLTILGARRAVIPLLHLCGALRGIRSG